MTARRSMRCTARPSFKTSPVQDDDHFFVVCRYGERNALRADLVKRAQDWRTNLGRNHRSPPGSCVDIAPAWTPEKEPIDDE